MVDAVRQRSRPHPAGLVNLAAALVVLFAVMLLALRANTTPPAIAEFAPTTQQNIKEAPQEQGSSFGNGQTVGGGLSPGGPGPGPGTAPTPVPSGPRSNCVGDPPRQIEDPQSPPCVPFWSGNNGGATSRGVTASTFKLFWVFQGTCGGNTQQDEASALLRFFNKRFQFYGRTIDLHCMNGGESDVPTLQAHADDVAAQGGFASTQYTNVGGLAYSQELARKGVVAGMGFEANSSEAQLGAYNPYMWSYAIAADNMLAEIGNWYCAELNGHVAGHTVPPFSLNQRKLGIVYNPWDPNQNTSFQPLFDALSRCGVKDVPVVNVVTGGVQGGSQAALTMEQDNVTTVMCLCNYVWWATSLSNEANGQNYFPEWINSSYGGGDSQFTFHFGNPAPEQAAHTFGLTFQPKQVSLPNDPMWWAWAEGGQGATHPGNVIDMYQGHLLYRSMLEILSGIQMAGPNLTPATFAAGLHKSIFPNPITGIHAGAVDFFGGSHAMTTDAAEWWYSPSTPSPWTSVNDAPGAICYVNRGVRHGITDWHANQPDLFFSGTCDNGA